MQENAASQTRTERQSGNRPGLQTSEAQRGQTPRAIPRVLEAVRENLLAFSDNIWDSIDHNDPQALDEGVQFKRAYNEKMAAFGLLATELSVLIQQYTTVRLEEAEQIGADDHERNQRIIAELNREEPHSLDEEFTFKRPHGFILDGQGTNGITTWRRVYELICQQLLRHDPGRFHGLPDNPDFISNRGNRSFSQGGKGAGSNRVRIVPVPFPDLLFPDQPLNDEARTAGRCRC